MDAKDFARIVGGRVCQGDETGKSRRLAGDLKDKNSGIALPLPIFDNPEDEKNFYKKYIATLTYVKVLGYNPDDISDTLIDVFWSIFSVGIDTLEGKNDLKDGD